MLGSLPPIDDPNVLVGTATADDAGVLRINDDLALVMTVDFFTPIVDDPRSFGRIAAANALSDVYAMGGRPVSAVAIAAFPEEGVPLAVLTDILRGGIEKAREAGISVIGGHTVKDAEPKYGLAVTGVVHPARIVRNSTAQPGDVLILTKRIGTGILTTACKQDRIAADELQAAIRSMETINRVASEIMVRWNADADASGRAVRAATDITGFGLIGHLLEMARGSDVGFILDANSVPFFEGVLPLAQAGCVPGGSAANRAAALAAGVHFEGALSEAMQSALCDAQTSGGLLLSTRTDVAPRLLQALKESGQSDAAIVGKITSERALRVI